jgi:NADH-quinone oxidoreductase subunit M
MGFCTLGLFTGTPDGIAGSVLQQVNHGISTGLLFLLVGIIYERRHTRKIADFGGVAASMPKFAVIFAIACFSSAGVPLLNGFIGEMTILRGTIERSFWWAALAAIGIVLGAAYLLWLYQRTMLGKAHDEANTRLRDLTGRELAVLLPLVAWAFWIGIYPKPHLDLLRPPVKAVVERLAAPAVATPPQQAQR